MRIRRRQRKIDLAGGGARDPGGAQRDLLALGGARARQGGSPTGPALRFFAALRMTEQEGGQAAFLRRKPASPLTVFQARGDEAQSAFGALRHPPLLPAQPDEGF